jgi:hypothetical protein
MAWFNAFSPFGMLAFSSKPTQAEVIYRQLKNAYGSGFVGPVAEARIYADAMALGVAQCELDRAAGQFRADRMTEGLAGAEAEYRIVPAPDANLKTRRAALAAAELLRNGARYDAMVDGLTGILGSAFVKYYVNNAQVAPQTPIPVNPLTAGTYKPVGSPITVVKIQARILPSALPQTCIYSFIAGDNMPLKAGETLEVDPGINGICEPITLLTADASKFSAIFSNPHDNGIIATSAPFPNQSCWQRHVLVIVTAETLTNVTLMQKLSAFMSKWTRIVTTWDVIADNGDRHHCGPFYPWQSGTYATMAAQAAAGFQPGLPGHTTIATIAY